MSWFNRNASGIEAAAACVTACVAVAALIGVKFQLDEADRLQATAAARDTYRSHLALAVAQPAFSQPSDVCAILGSDKALSYAAFVDHLLYSAELMLATDDSWSDVFKENLTPHAAYICSDMSPVGGPPELTALLASFRATTCPSVPACN